MTFIAIYGNVFGYIRRALLLMVCQRIPMDIGIWARTPGISNQLICAHISFKNTDIEIDLEKGVFQLLFRVLGRSIKFKPIPG
jgi:hypothetical protein